MTCRTSLCAVLRLWASSWRKPSPCWGQQNNVHLRRSRGDSLSLSLSLSLSVSLSLKLYFLNLSLYLKLILSGSINVDTSDFVYKQTQSKVSVPNFTVSMSSVLFTRCITQGFLWTHYAWMAWRSVLDYPQLCFSLLFCSKHWPRWCYDTNCCCQADFTNSIHVISCWLVILINWWCTLA